eukprot:CAMPEP_0197423224 /NCGR_PEP_ID=MMETSP1170-20131217/20233_1 /TAXON_ID=54406 /ORGANISM="Sarcinochrysis sp, Strain CCMP770" /LENGTH=219 /DNA_ID=CAMNT_0042950625 /DNA_START=22 /DNA_END=681 /DNA_ORIENTATION=+
MKKACLVVVLAAVVGNAAADEVVLATFGSASSLTWQEMNDPVMGGESTGNFSLTANATGKFQGVVKNVSFLGAPGFCQVETTSLFSTNISSFLDGGIALTIAATATPTYGGFKFAFSAVGAPRHHGGHEATGSYKTSFNASSQRIFLPFASFSSDWSDYTGDCDTLDPDGYQHVCCDDDHTDVCPDARRLAQVTGYSIWAEGTEGTFDLEVTQIAAALN